MDTLPHHALFQQELPWNSVSQPEKQCTGPCGRTLPATTEFFHIGRRYKDGLRPQCKECKSLERRAFYRRPEVREKTLEQNKAYRNRPEIKEKDRVRRQAYNSRPEIQERERSRWKDYSSRPEVQERIRARMKAYHARPDINAHLRAYQAEYYSHPENRLNRSVQAKIYNHRPDIKERRRILAQAYYRRPEVRAKMRFHDHLRRVRKMAVPGTLTPEQIQQKLKAQKYKCYYAACGHAKFEKRNGKYVYHLEHTIPLSRPSEGPRHDVNFVVLSCPSCNFKKNKKLPHEFWEGGRLL